MEIAYAITMSFFIFERWYFYEKQSKSPAVSHFRPPGGSAPAVLRGSRPAEPLRGTADLLRPLAVHGVWRGGAGGTEPCQGAVLPAALPQRAGALHRLRGSDPALPLGRRAGDPHPVPQNRPRPGQGHRAPALKLPPGGGNPPPGERSAIIF